jgi:protocatechuate 3,4-dioxygenase alpha subunit
MSLEADKLGRLVPSASQTVGPFFNFGLTANRCLGILAREGAAGERVRLSFRVLDGDGAPTKGDAMIELWQADAQGRYAHPADPRSASADPNFCGFGRLEANGLGICVFETVKPGRVPDAEGRLQAPHINVAVFARGLLRHLVTRVYFADEPANDEDAVLALVPAQRRETLMAHRVPGEPYSWLMEIRLQGDAETVFFDV